MKLSKSYAAVDVQLVESEAPPPAVHLLVPIADRERMLWLAEKATELGLASWRPVMWRRSKSVSPRGEGVGFQEKVRARMIAALTQSGGSWLPTLFPDAPLERAILAAPEGGGLRFLLDQEGAPMLLHVRAEVGDTPALGRSPLTLALGPEGGLEPAERDALRGAGFVPVSLGDRTLRFETAGLAALAIVRAALTASSGGTRG